jgi:hypothetical protein
MGLYRSQRVSGFEFLVFSCKCPLVSEQPVTKNSQLIIYNYQPHLGKNVSALYNAYSSA